jgi:hypothetical protein
MHLGFFVRAQLVYLPIQCRWMWLPVIEKQCSPNSTKNRQFAMLPVHSAWGTRWTSNSICVKWGCMLSPCFEDWYTTFAVWTVPELAVVSMRLAIFTANVSTFHIRNQNLVLSVTCEILCKCEMLCEILYYFLSVHRLCDIVRLNICDIYVTCAVLVNEPKLWLYYLLFLLHCCLVHC